MVLAVFRKFTELENYEPGDPVPWFDDEHTNPLNESSIVLGLDLYPFQRRFLFTGDVGKEGLSRAFKCMDKCGTGPWYFNHVQIPHHGSRKNICPELLEQFENPTYIVSCPPSGVDEGHPSRRLINRILNENIETAIYTTRFQNCVFSEGTLARNCKMTKESFYQVMDGEIKRL